MSPENLAIVMAPNVLRPQGEKVSLDALGTLLNAIEVSILSKSDSFISWFLVDTQVATKLLAALIAQYDVILDTIDIPPPPSPRGEAEADSGATDANGKKRFQPKLVKGHFEEKYGMIREGSNPLSGKRVGDMEVITPERLAQSQGSKRTGLSLNIGAALEVNEDGEKTRVRSKSASRRSQTGSEVESGRPLSARETVKREGSNNSFTSSTSSEDVKNGREDEPRVRARAASISKREAPQINNALDWILLAQTGGHADASEDSEDVEKHNAEVRKKRDEQFEELQRQREQRRLKKEEKDRKRKERQRERARITVETGVDPGSQSSSDSED